MCFYYHKNSRLPSDIPKKRAFVVGPFTKPKRMETKKYRGGAPRKEASERKDRIVRVMFTQGEHDRLMKRKSATKARNLSSFIRDVCLDKPLHMKPQLTTHQTTVLAMLKEIRLDVLRIGVNINQSSKRINSTTDYHDLQHEVNSMVDNVAQWDAQLSALLASLDGEHQPATRLKQPTDGSPDQ